MTDDPIAAPIEAFPAPPSGAPPVPLTPSAPAIDGPVGIAGWLLLPAIGLVLSVAAAAWGVASWVLLSGKLQSGMVLPYTLTLVLSSLDLVAVLAAAILFFMRSRYAPKAYIGMSAIDLAISIMLFGLWTAFGASQVAAMVGAVIPGAAARTAIWAAYFMRSKRVANTFTR